MERVVPPRPIRLIASTKMKLTSYHLVVVPMALAASLCSGCGMVTTRLVESCKRHYPPVDTYRSVYWKKNIIAVEYSIQEPRHPKQAKKSETYWAELNRSHLRAGPASKSGETIHREPLPERIRKTWQELPIQELRDVDPGKFYVWDYIRRQPASETPEVYRNQNRLHIRYSKSNGALLKAFCPSGDYIDPIQYPKLILLYPFAVVGDIVTFPLLCFTPAWPM